MTVAVKIRMVPLRNAALATRCTGFRSNSIRASAIFHALRRAAIVAIQQA
jgi:hypothetical protein